MDAKFEKAMVVERQSREAIAASLAGRTGLHCEIVGTNGDDAAVGDPLQQPLVTAIKNRARICKHLAVRLFVHR